MSKSKQEIVDELIMTSQTDAVLRYHNDSNYPTKLAIANIKSTLSILTEYAIGTEQTNVDCDKLTQSVYETSISTLKRISGKGLDQIRHNEIKIDVARCEGTIALDEYWAILITDKKPAYFESESRVTVSEHPARKNLSEFSTYGLDGITALCQCGEIYFYLVAKRLFRLTKQEKDVLVARLTSGHVFKLDEDGEKNPYIPTFKTIYPEEALVTAKLVEDIVNANT